MAELKLLQKHVYEIENTANPSGKSLVLVVSPTYLNHERIKVFAVEQSGKKGDCVVEVNFGGVYQIICRPFFIARSRFLQEVPDFVLNSKEWASILEPLSDYYASEESFLKISKRRMEDLINRSEGTSINLNGESLKKFDVFETQEYKALQAKVKALEGKGKVSDSDEVNSYKSKAEALEGICGDLKKETDELKESINKLKEDNNKLQLENKKLSETTPVTASTPKNIELAIGLLKTTLEGASDRDKSFIQSALYMLTS